MQIKDSLIEIESTYSINTFPIYNLNYFNFDDLEHTITINTPGLYNSFHIPEYKYYGFKVAFLNKCSDLNLEYIRDEKEGNYIFLKSIVNLCFNYKEPVYRINVFNSQKNWSTFGISSEVYNQLLTKGFGNENSSLK